MDFVCAECGFSDHNNHTNCPSCGENFHKPVIMIRDSLMVKYISKDKGRGVFTTSKIPYGTLIESCPVIPVPKSEAVLTVGTVLWGYLFPWKEYDTVMGDRAVALGYGMLYNHSNDPSARYLFNDNEQLPSIDFYALRDIEIGEEITIFYGDHLWFRKVE